jgi:putative DNA primase/helicase
VKISTFLERFPNVVTEQDGWVVACPAHSDRHESLRVAIGKNGKLLLRCRAGCKTAEVVRSLGLTFADLAKVETDGEPIARSEATPASDNDVAKLAVDIDRWAAELATEYTEEGDPIGPAAVYLDRRFGIDQELAGALRLGSTDELMGGRRLVVPFTDPRGVARGHQARALAPNAKVRWQGAKSPAGASWSRLAFLKAVESYDQVVVTEGPSDALTTVAVGYDTIAVRGAGIANDQATVDMIAAWVGDREAVVVGDSDASGNGFAQALLNGLRLRGVRAARLEVPAPDVNEWRMTDPGSFVALFQTAVKGLHFTRRAAAVERTEMDLTELGAAQRIRSYLQAAGSDVRHTVENGFYLLDRGVWLQDTLGQVRTVAHEVAAEVWDEVEQTERQIEEDRAGELEITKERLTELAKLRRFAKHVSSKIGIDAALNELRVLPSVSISINDLDQHPHLLAVANGTIDLTDGTLGPTDPKLLLSRRLDVEFHPDAQAPRWGAFLREIFPSNPVDMPEFLRRLIGYGITGYTDEQCFAVLWGTGANGKSVLTEVLTRVFRTITTTTPFSTFEVKTGGGGIPNDVAALKGARLVMASEGEAGKPMAEAMLKRVTGRDMIAARFMRQEFFEFLPTFLLMLATNYKPNFRGQDEGLWRRVKLIQFERFFKPEERDPRLSQSLMDEAEGILAWAVSGAVDWKRDGSLREPEVLQLLTASYKFDSDALAGFLPGIYVMDEESTTLVPKADIWEAYQTWTEEEHLPSAARWSRRAFYRAIEERGGRGVQVGAVRGFKGIRLATDDEQAEMSNTEPITESPTVDPRAVVGRPTAPTTTDMPPDLDDM